MRRSPNTPWLVLACYLACSWGALAACDVDLERMIEQARFDPYEPSPYFPDGTIMQHPPAGTVPRSRPLLSAAVADGAVDVAGGTGESLPVDRIPIAVTRDLVQRGRNRYDIFCAPCHGVVGDGSSQVAENMALRPPPPLVTAPVRNYPVGRIYRVIKYGYGLMPSYAAQIPVVEDRWAVVAYVQALQLSQSVALDDLPPGLRQEAEPWLK